jgi:hypothetical protein
MEARIDMNNEKLEVLRDSLVSWLDIHQARTMSTREMRAKMAIHQEKMEATIHSIQSKLDEIIKHQVEDVPSYVDQKTQGLSKELTEKIKETQDLQADKGPPGNQNRHKGAHSRRAQPHNPGRGTNDEDRNRYNVGRT